jgi:hypothetical protein
VRGVEWDGDEYVREEQLPIGRLSNENTEKEVFLPRYQQHGIGSWLLYLLFVFLLLLELIATVFCFGDGHSSIVSIAFTVLCA